MTEVEKCAEELARSIEKSPERQRLEEAKKRIDGNEELRNQIDNFRRDSYLSQNTMNYQNELEVMQNLFNEHQKVHMNRDAAEYLDAELSYCRMLQKICLRILAISDLQLDNLEDAIKVSE